MQERFSAFGNWVTFAGCVLVVAVLYWAQAVLVPVALAILISFVLTPPVLSLQRRIGRLPAILLVVTLVFSGLGLATYGIVRQLGSLSTDLVTYRTNIRAKVRDVRGVGRGGSVERLQSTLEDIKKDMGVPTAPQGTVTQPVVVSHDESSLPGLSWLGPFVAPAGTASFVVVLVLFMLLEREDLRNRLIGLIGHGHLAVTTKAFDEAGSRVSKQLLLQTLVNAIYGGLSAAGLWMFGVPYPLFWGAAGAGLRYIPYIGPIIASAGPFVIALAALPGWTRPLEVAGFYLLLELFTNLVLETVLYAGAAGVSQVALLVAVAFWTWLWGPLGLLMATPLTVCLVVLGKFVPGLKFVATLLADTPPLAPEYGYYQRLLARDVGEAVEVVERFAKGQPAEQVYDALLIPALNYAERDRLESRLEAEDEQALIDATRELMSEALLAPGAGEPAADATAPVVAPTEVHPRLRVLGYAANGQGDVLALEMLARLIEGLPIAVESGPTRLLASSLIEVVRAEHYDAICIADLPPSPPSKTRYLVKRLRAALPDLPILVGRWATGELADETTQPLVDAGASSVSTTLLDTRRHLTELARLGSEPAPDRANAAA
jgi:predicted PurR-regulated permease PerM